MKGSIHVCKVKETEKLDHALLPRLSDVGKHNALMIR